MHKITNLKFMEADEPCLTEDKAFFLRGWLDRTLKIATEFEWNLQSAEQNGKCKGTSKMCPCTNVKEIGDGQMCSEVCRLTSTCAVFKNGKCPGIYCYKFISPCIDCNDWFRSCNKCKFSWDPKKDPNGVRNLLQTDLKPTGTSGNFGKNGVHAVKKDGSLAGNGGVEITTVGRRVDYFAFLKQFKGIFDKVDKFGAYVDNRASIHYHVLISYGGNDASNTHAFSSIEEPIPGIFLRNFHQLFRIFHNPIIWMTSAGTSWDKLTRWAQFRKSMITVSGVKHKAREIVEMLYKKYNMLSYRDCVVSNNLLDVFHVEARYCDGLKSATAAAALAMLLYAFAMKAIDMSMHGIIAMPDDFYQKQKEIAKMLINNNSGSGDYSGPRFSRTIGIQEHADHIKLFSKQMLDFVKVYLKRWPQAIDVLQSLAERPCSLRLIEGETWEQIEANLYEVGKKPQVLGEAELETLKIIDLCLVYGDDPERWIKKTSDETGKGELAMNKVIESLSKKKLIVWSPEDQTFTRV